jgi:uncharacterized protein
MVISANLSLTRNRGTFFRFVFCSHLRKFKTAEVLKEMELNLDLKENQIVLASETIFFRGHQNVLATHENTLEITREEEISKRADCILGVSASKACSDLDAKLKAHIKSEGQLRFEIIVGSFRYNFSGRGSKLLELTDHKEIVLRRSDFASARTAAVRCDAAAIDVPREIVSSLQNQSCAGWLKISAIQRKEKENEIPSLNILDR